MSRTTRCAAVLAVVCMVMGATGAMGGTIPVLIDPVLPDFGLATFHPIESATLTNPFFPASTFIQYIYEGEFDDEGETILERIVVTTTPEVKQILGVRCRVINDKAFENGVLMENTDDWYAQDLAGNVWYMGEESISYEYDDDGNFLGINDEGSWEAGDDGAEAGVLMWANPAVGMSYYQEWYEGEAEDQAQVESLILPVSVPYGDFTNTLQTLETTALDEEVFEFKYYAYGLGLLLEQELEVEGPLDGLIALDPGDYEVVKRIELISASTPEPTTLTLLALGGLGLLRRRRRR